VASPGLAEKFIIEKMSANSWRPLYTLQAENLMQDYSYTDAKPDPGINMYRLKVIENNNSFFYSAARELNRDQNNDGFVLYPNPAAQQLTVLGKFPLISRLRLFDSFGKLQWDKNIMTSNGNINLDLSSLQPGVYVLQIEGVSKKLIIRK
jgi:hypothetical protein